MAASLLGVSLFAGGAAGSLALVGVTAGIGSVRRLGHATATGIALAGAFATGVLMLTTQPGSSKDLEAFLVGSVLTVTPADLVATLVAGAILLVVLFLAHKELLVTAFDPLMAGAMGYPVRAIGVLVLGAVAVTVACAVTAVGTILVVTLLIAPPLTARLWVDRSSRLFVLSAALGAGAGSSASPVRRSGVWPAGQR